MSEKTIRVRGQEIPVFEQTDVFTGEEFFSRVERHYEAVDPKPFAPPVTMARPTIRQRVENLLNRGVDPLAHYVGTEGVDLDVPDDPDAPLTDSEMNYIQAVHESLAEQAPLPDEGMPRPDPTPPPAAPAPSPQAPQPPREDAAAAPAAKPVPT